MRLEDMTLLLSSFAISSIFAVINIVHVEGRRDELPKYHVYGDRTADGTAMPNANHGGELEQSEVEPLSNNNFLHDLGSLLPVFAPTSDKISNEVCKKHSLIFKQQLQQHKLWALKMHDSTAKLPSGILSGHMNQLGDFDQCLDVGTEENSSIKGKYCLAMVDITAMANISHNLQETVNLIQSYAPVRSSLKDPAHLMARFTTFRWGMCVPASCSSTDIQQAMEYALADHNVTSGIKFDVHVDPQTCTTKQDTQKSFSGATICTLALFFTLLSVAIAASVIDRKSKQQNEQGKLKRILLAFSVYRNIGILNKDLPPEGEINCIHGIRAIFTLATYLAHRIVVVVFAVTSNRQTIAEISGHNAGVILRTSYLFPEAFFLLSGVLAAFNICKEKETRLHVLWFKKCITRWLRLTPPIVAIVLFYSNVMEHLGNGPQWNLVVKKNADLCKENFWENIFYIQNFLPFEETCASQTHHAASDMQLSLLSPLLVGLLWKKQVLGVAFLSFLCFTSLVLRYQAVFQHQLAYFIYHGISIKKLYEIGNFTFCKALHRAVPYLLGVGLGYFLYKYGKKFNISKFVLTMGWIIATCFAYFSMISPYHTGFRDFKYDVYEASLYAVYSTTFWSLTLCWVIWICYTGNADWLNKFLSCKFLVLCSRMSYAVCLTQFAVFFCSIGSLRTMQYFSLARAIDFGELLVIVSASLALVLLFELPAQEIKKILSGGERRKDIVPEDSNRSTTSDKSKLH